MKFSQTTLLAILASAAVVAAAPLETPQADFTLIKRSDANEVLEILNELQSLHAKRDLSSGDEYLELSKRADTVIGNFISALLNSGIIGEVWNTLTTDQDIRTEILAIVKATFQAALVQGPALIKSLLQSGLIPKLFNTLLNDTDLRSAFLGLVKALFSNAANLLASKAGSGSATTAAAAPAPAATPAPAPAGSKRELIIEGDSEYLEKKDLASVITTVVNLIKSTGIVQSLVQKVLADPQASISFLTSALKNGLVLFEDVYGWAKQSGVLQSGLNWLAQNGGAFLGDIAKIVGSALGSGSVTPSEINNASSGSTSTPSTGAPKAPAPNTSAALPPTPVGTAPAAGSTNNSVYAQLLAQYGGSGSGATAAAGSGSGSAFTGVAGSSTLVHKRRNY